jgi:general secretion pathway protein F
MASFRYRAVTASGATINGVVDAASPAVAAQQLRAQGHYPLFVREAGTKVLSGLLHRELRFRRKPSLRGLATLTQELATLLGAGLELDRALSILVKLADIGALREPLLGVRARVRDGASLADAMAQDPAFSKFYVGMVRAGEYGGTLEATLKRLADYLRRSLAVRESVASALVYPLLLLITAGFSIIIILVFVLPEFEPLFADAGKQLPLATRIVMGAADAIRDYWWLILAVIAGAVAAARYALSKPHIALRWDRFVLEVPVFGRLIQAIEVERLSRTLGTLLTNGVPLPPALELARDAARNKAVAKALGDTAASVREGKSLALRLAQAQLFPPAMIDFVKVGEESGKLDAMLLHQADLDEQHVRHTIDRLLAILVPALTIVLGVIVAGLIASLLVAILSVNDLAIQ